MTRFRLRTLLIVFALLPLPLALPASAKAQWATTAIEHDWTVEVGEHRFGLEQSITLPGSYRKTTIYLGRISVQSNLRAGAIVALVVVPIAMLLAAVAISTKCAGPNRNT